VCLGGFWIMKAWNGHESSETAKTSIVSMPHAHSADDLDDVRLHLAHAQNNLTAVTAQAKRIQDRLRQLATTINVTGTESQRNRLRDADNSSQAVLRNLSEALEEIATARERTTKIK